MATRRDFNSFKDRMIRAVGFDLGDTLLEYEGVPLNWELEYPGALAAVAAACGREPTPTEMEAACAVLRGFNTRLSPRMREVDHVEVFGSVLAEWGVSTGRDTTAVDVAADAFFEVFQRHTRAFPDVGALLHRLEDGGIPYGVLTDVPYGMPRRLVSRDLASAGLTELEGVLITSTEVRTRKPNPRGFELLAERLCCDPSEVLYAGNEVKDVEGALAAGMRAALIWRPAGDVPDWGQHLTVSSLDALPVAAEWPSDMRADPA